MFKYLIYKLIKNFIFLLFSLTFITSCTNDGNKTFNIINEAKTFFYEELGLNSEKEKIKAKKKKTDSVEKPKIESKQKKEKVSDEDSTTFSNIENDTFNKSISDLIEEEEELTKKTKKNNKEKEFIKSRLLDSEQKDLIEYETSIENDNLLIKDKRIKIGVMLPLTGEKKNIGKMILNALELGIFENNNPNMELVIKDTKADPLTTVSVFNELLLLNVKNIIGPLFASSLLAIEDRVIENKVKIFALTNNTNMAGKNVWVFGIDPEQQARKITEFAIEEGFKKIAILIPKNEYGTLILENISTTLAQNGLKPERTQFFENNIENQEIAARNISEGFNKYNQRIKILSEEMEKGGEDKLVQLEEIEKPFDSVVIAASGQNLTILASQLQYNGVDPKNVAYLGLSPWENDSILGEPALDGGFFSSTGEGYQKDIKNTYETYFDEDMSKIAMLAYDILALININLTESKNIDSESLVNEDGFVGLRGLFRLKKNGTVERAFQIKKIKNKKFQTYKEAPESFFSFN